MPKARGDNDRQQKPIQQLGAALADQHNRQKQMQACSQRETQQAQCVFDEHDP